MGGFVAALGLAIPVVQKIAGDIKDAIDSKKSDKKVQGDASQAATTAAKVDAKKGAAAADAVTPVVTEAAKAAADQVAQNASAAYSKMQEDLSEQLAIAASLQHFFHAEDNLYAMREVITVKGDKLDLHDLVMLRNWWDTASNNLTKIGEQDASLQKLEDPERTTILFVHDATDDGTVLRIENALKTLGGNDPSLDLLRDNVVNLHDRLDKATFSVLRIIQDFSDGLKNSAGAEKEGLQKVAAAG
jgi:hypothetical protein